MPEFLVVALVLVLVAAAFVLFPLMMHRSAVESTRETVNVGLFKQRLRELEAERQQAGLDEEEFQLLKTELQRRLLDEAGSQDDSGKSPDGLLGRGKTPVTAIALLLALSIPLVSFGLYQQIGAQADWDISETLRQIRHKTAAGEDVAAENTQLLLQVSTRLQQRPDNSSYLMLLGRARMQQKDYLAASQAFQRLASLWPEDPSVLAQYAQSLYLAAGRKLSPDMLDIAHRALAIEPAQPTVLGLLGIASFEQGDYRSAIKHWQALLPTLGPYSPNRKMIQAGIDQAKALLHESGGSLASAAATTEAKTKVSTPPASLQVEVALGEGIRAEGGDAVFIFARAVAGPRMPLAVVKLKVSDLPARITLDDSMAMAPGMTLSSFEQVEIVAKISKRGIANPGPGDIEAVVGPITVAETKATIVLVID